MGDIFSTALVDELTIPAVIARFRNFFAYVPSITASLGISSPHAYGRPQVVEEWTARKGIQPIALHFSVGRLLAATENPVQTTLVGSTNSIGGTWNSFSVGDDTYVASGLA